MDALQLFFYFCLCIRWQEPGLTASGREHRVPKRRFIMTPSFKTILNMTLAVFALAMPALAMPAAAQAGTAILLSGDNTLSMIDTSARKVTGSMKLSGAEGAVIGIDVRPSDGLLYALMADGTVVTLDKEGKATKKVKLETTLKAGTSGTVNFNPVADRLRIIGADGTNLRANVDDGKVTTDGALKFAETDMHKGETPMIVAAAYTNSVKGAKETALYNIDAKIGGLIKQAPPNDGILGAVGKLGATPKAIGFDIETDAAGTNRAWLIGDGELHSIDLATGKATSLGKIEGVPSGVRAMAVMAPL